MSPDTRQQGTLAAALLAILGVLFLVHPWVLPSGATGTVLGLPTWYWISFGVMVLMYVVYYAFTTRMDEFYAVLGVSE